MTIGHGHGSQRGMKADRQACPLCGRDIAISYDPNGETIRWRKHQPCGAGIERPRDDPLSLLIRELRAEP